MKTATVQPMKVPGCSCSALPDCSGVFDCSSVPNGQCDSITGCSLDMSYGRCSDDDSFCDEDSDCDNNDCVRE